MCTPAGRATLLIVCVAKLALPPVVVGVIGPVTLMPSTSRWNFPGAAAVFALARRICRSYVPAEAMSRVYSIHSPAFTHAS